MRNPARTNESCSCRAAIRLRQRYSLGPIANEDEAEIRMLAPEQGGGLDELVKALLGAEPAHGHDDSSRFLGKKSLQQVRDMPDRARRGSGSTALRITVIRLAGTPAWRTRAAMAAETQTVRSDQRMIQRSTHSYAANPGRGGRPAVGHANNGNAA